MEVIGKDMHPINDPDSMKYLREVRDGVMYGRDDMDGTMYNVIRGLHDQLEMYRKKFGTGDKWPDECDAVLKALAELETVPKWAAISKAIESSQEATA